MLSWKFNAVLATQDCGDTHFWVIQNPIPKPYILQSKIFASSVQKVFSWNSFSIIYPKLRKVRNILPHVGNIHIHKIYSIIPFTITSLFYNYIHIRIFEKAQKNIKKKINITHNPISRNSHCYRFGLFLSNLFLCIYIHLMQQKSHHMSVILLLSLNLVSSWFSVLFNII